MALIIDDRVGSVELAPMLEQLAGKDYPVSVTRMDAGDFAIYSQYGSATDGPVQVGIERKRIRDLITSMHTGRLSGSQFPAMLQTYAFCYLIVEGNYRRNFNTTRIEIPGRDRTWKPLNCDYRAIDGYLNTLRLKTPIQVIKTGYPQETAMELHLLHSWFTSKRFSRHESHIRFPHTIHSPGARMDLSRPSYFRLMVKELPHIGWERSRQAEVVFDGDLAAAVGGTVEDWAMIDGITEARAVEIVRVLRKHNRVE